MSDLSLISTGKYAMKLLQHHKCTNALISVNLLYGGDAMHKTFANV